MTSAPVVNGPAAAVPRLLAGVDATGFPDDHRSHLLRHGPLPLPGGRQERAGMLDAVEAAGLRGRGGGGYPAAAKLRAVARSRGRAVVVANGTESEPLSRKDLTLLRLRPHLVLDGIALAADLVEARQAVLAVHRGGPLAGALEAAIAERADPVPARLVTVPRRYVAGESSALARFLTDGDARPTTSPPRTAQRGVDGRPTLVANVETLAHLALIARHGPAWFRGVGSARTPGTTLVTVGGAVATPAVLEVAGGIDLATVLALAGGPAAPPAAALVGGWAGTWVPVGRLPTTGLDAGAGLGLVSFLPAGACGLAETARILDRLARASAAQCGPCTFGMPTVAAEFARLVSAPTDDEHRRRLRGHLSDITGRGACAHPDGAARLARSALTTFPADVLAHSAGRPCLGASAPPLLTPPHPEESR